MNLSQGSISAENIFTNELENNDFFKPPAAIKSVRSSTEGVIGAIKKTTIEFTVHNFSDYEHIYNRYFYLALL